MKTPNSNLNANQTLCPIHFIHTWMHLSIAIGSAAIGAGAISAAIAGAIGAAIGTGAIGAAIAACAIAAAATVAAATGVRTVRAEPWRRSLEVALAIRLAISTL